MVMCDFNIDFKNEEDPNHVKFNNLCDIFSITNLAEDHTCFTKRHFHLIY